MEKIATIGSQNYSNKTKIKEFIYGLKTKCNSRPIIIQGGGRRAGADPLIKKYSIEFEMLYEEYNPAYTPRNLYSVLPYSYFDKPFMVHHNTQRNKIMINSCNKIVIFMNDDEPLTKEFRDLINYAEKKNKKVLIIN